MNSNARLMLEALRNSSNENTRDSVGLILHATVMNDTSVGNNPSVAESRAVAGFYGDFLRAVMTGDFIQAYGAADRSNQRALVAILGINDDRW